MADPIDQIVEDGLRNYAVIRRERDDLLERTERLGADLALARQRVEAAERREREVQARCDHYMKRVADLKARISVISSACLEAVNRAGDAMYEQPELGVEIDDGIKALAAKFGAGREPAGTA